MGKFITNSSDLIATTNTMMQISAQGQQNVLKIKEIMEKEEAERKVEISELEFDTISFIASNGRFFLNMPELNKIMEHISRVEIKVGIKKLPIGAFLIKGYFISVKQSNYKWGIDQFDQVIEKETPLKPRALLNRGINRANLNDYERAIEDIQNAIKSRPGNMLYEFYLLDTKLLHARKEETLTGKTNLKNELLSKFTELFNRCMQQSAPEPGEEMKLAQLLNRIGTDLASLLIWECSESISKVNEVLDIIPSKKSIVLFLKLECIFKNNTIPDNGLLDHCIESLSQEYENSAELNGKILRGLSILQCHLWNKDQNAFNAIKPKVRGNADVFKQTFGEEAIVFSPISRKNESIVEIINQIDTMSKKLKAN